MALGRSVTDGFRKLTLEGLRISGSDIDIQSLKIVPILRPYTILAVARIVTAAGDTWDINIQWQATPRIPENADLGPVVGAERQAPMVG